MKHGRFNIKPAQAHCKRCGELFVYFLIASPRRYCAKCVEIERLDLLEFTKVQRRRATAMKRCQEARAA